MRWVALCALILLGISVGLSACTMPFASKSKATVSSQAVINQAISELQAALGLADGAVSQSTQPPLLADSDVVLTWLGGKADVDLKSGRISAVLVDSTAGASGTSLPGATLDDDADRLAGLLGWDSVALQTAGFTPGGSQTIAYDQAGPVFEKTWAGHDSEGIPNEGVIEVGLSATSGDLHSFLFSPGPAVGLDVSRAISRDQATRTALSAAAKNAVTSASTSSTSVKVSTTTTGSKTSSTGGGTTTTTAPGGFQVQSATLVHTNKRGITAGKDLLVWVVQLSANTGAGEAGAIVYVDAVSDKALVITAT
jgi:hypothetical protein